MKILMLTWEFPPLITGGLGMACYGIAKELLKHGDQIDLIMPAKKPVYLSLRNEKDVDELPMSFVNKPEKRTSLSKQNITEFIGTSLSAYYTTNPELWNIEELEKLHHLDPFKYVYDALNTNDFLFCQVKAYTDFAIETASKLDFDIIHAHDWLTYPAAMAIKRFSSKPLVTHLHATEFDRAGGPGDPRIHDIEYAGMTYADKVITVSDYTAKIIKNKYLIGSTKIRVVHNAYSHENMINNPRRIFKDPTVLFMGRITLQKGPDYFVKVAQKVLNQQDNVRFIMAGTGDMQREVLHKTAEMQMGAKFLFAGFLSRKKVECILNATDIFILPSISEPFGIAPLEAMSKGAVAIISKKSGVAEVVQNAYKVDFWDINRMAEIIIELAQNPELLKKLSKQSKTEIKKMKWEDAVNKIINVFYELGKNEKCSI